MLHSLMEGIQDKPDVDRVRHGKRERDGEGGRERRREGGREEGRKGGKRKVAAIILPQIGRACFPCKKTATFGET